MVLEKDQTDQDQYGRLLRYLVLNGLNINLRLIEDGLAICRFYDPDTRYKDSCVDLEKQAKNNEVGCKWAVSLPIPSASECTKLTPKKTGLELIQAEDAIDYLYEDKIVEGKVANTIEYSNSALFINFCKPYPNNCFTSIIWNSNWGKFPENAAEIYSNQTVRVEGRIELYRGKPQIVLDDSSQIEICE